MSRILYTAEEIHQETPLKTVITPPMDWFSRKLSDLSLGSEQLATGGAVSYGWSCKLRVEQAATGGAVSYGWSSQLRVEQSATGGAVSYGWSSQLLVELSATGGATTTTVMAKFQLLHSRHLASY
jgi:hypothetical protein